MTALVQDSVDVVHEFAAAVLYVADVDRPGLTLWDALGEAVQMWIEGDETRGSHRTDHRRGDGLRLVIEHLLATTAGVGLPGGATISMVFEAAMAMWSDSAAQRLNQGSRFAS